MILLGLFIIVIIYYTIQWNRSKQLEEGKDSESDLTRTFYINPCKHPNCVRCTRYREIQRGAKRRLPYLVRQRLNPARIDISDKEIIELSSFQRIIDGVKNNETSELRKKYAIDQRPTVLFIPNLYHQTNNSDGDDGPGPDVDNKNAVLAQTQVPSPIQHAVLIPSVVTQLHRQACNAFTNNPKIREIMMNEYIHAQINAQWTCNNSAGTVHADLGNKQKSDELWEVLYLMNQGNWIEENIELYCPKTYAFINNELQQLLMQNCIFGNVFFSVLYPGTIIEPHCGPSNIRHRLHFALSIPSIVASVVNKNNNDKHNNVPILKVGNEILHWEEGNAFVFDDSLVHSAEYANDNLQNGGRGEVRVVLVVDLWHPALSNNERELLCDLYPPTFTTNDK